MSAIYNENAPFVASWLEDLIAHDLIAPGTVDRRSIADLQPSDVTGPGQRHFFAGIGGWSYALRLAGVRDDVDVWTGSCPCQPFSDAGTGQGVRDPRHLWPAWFALIEQCRPPIVFGEQVASRDGLEWFDAVSADLERCGYAVGATDLCAAGVGAPHIRQRLYFVAHTDGVSGGYSYRNGNRQLGNPSGTRGRRDTGAVHGQESESEGEGRVPGRFADESQHAGQDRCVADAGSSGSQDRRHARAAIHRSDDCGMANPEEARRPAGRLSRAHGRPSIQPDRHGADSWAVPDWIPCSDGVSRPVEPGTFPLAHGVPSRVGLLSGYGNAVVPQVAAAFIRASLEAIDLASGKPR